MKKMIRKGVFETNSSSCHSISIADETKEFVLDTIYPDQDGVIELEGGQFGRGWFKHNDALTKANYAAVSFMNDEKLLGLLTKILKDQTGADEVKYTMSDDYNKNWSYIDHESQGLVPIGEVELKNFIFNKNSWLFGGNDNQIPDPTFYHVPEFKDNRMIVPKYKYELSIEGYKRKTKFLEKPTESEIGEGLDAILSGIRLYDNGYFDDDNSINNIILRPKKDYYEFTTWELPVDYENNVCYFINSNLFNIAKKEYNKTPESETEDWSDVGYEKVREIEKNLIESKDSKIVKSVKFYVTEL
jgi:hypothetical protein